MSFVNRVINLLNRYQMKIYAIILICVMAIGVSITSAQELVPVGLQKQLLVDNYVIYL
jgi:hypothetical protein